MRWHIKSNHMLYHMMAQVINMAMIPFHLEVLLQHHCNMLFITGIECLSLQQIEQVYYVVRNQQL